jgi:NitT/TauT family transport system substrate-binding protein
MVSNMAPCILSLAVLAVIVSTACLGQTGTIGIQPGTSERIVVGMEPNQVNSLIIIADDQGYFTDNGLNVTIRDYPSGAAAVEGLVRGESDIATSTEFVLVGRALSHQPLSGFASIDRFQQIHLLGRRDRGIADFSDLGGKRIGLPQKTAAEFYLGRFLQLHAMNLGDVEMVNVPPAQAADAISEGSVDAVVAWQPNVDSIMLRMGTNVVDWPVQGSQPAYCVAVAQDSWIAANPGSIDRFLAALRSAEEFTANKPDESRDIVRKRLSYGSQYISEIWPDHQFSVTLDQSLVLAMEDEARWMIANNLTNATSVPDFGNYLYTGGLETAKPDAVNIIR